MLTRLQMRMSVILLKLFSGLSFLAVDLLLVAGSRVISRRHLLKLVSSTIHHSGTLFQQSDLSLHFSLALCLGNR